MKQVCVLIPMYQPRLNGVEQTAFDNIYNSLSGHNVTLLKPHSLDFRHLKKDYPQLAVQSFDESYFQGFNPFNRLMLSDEFYERFSDFEYLLIAKLDVYIFGDALSGFCAKGYDYISTPYIGQHSWIARLLAKDKGAADRIGGNPSIALRKVDSHLEALKKYDERRKYYLENQIDERLFWQTEVPEFKLADNQESLSFAFGQHPKQCYLLNGNKLPFACCNWHSKGEKTKFWKQYI